jgi:hypothetical protein
MGSAQIERNASRFQNDKAAIVSAQRREHGASIAALCIAGISQNVVNCEASLERQSPKWPGWTAIPPGCAL